MTDNINDYLMDLADPKPRTEPEPARAGDITGVAFPEEGAPTPGSIMNPDGARTLGAQLIRAADLHDAIWERGLEASRSDRLASSWARDVSAIRDRQESELTSPRRHVESWRSEDHREILSPAEPFQLIREDTYTVVIAHAEIRPLRAGRGHYNAVTAVVIEGESIGTIFHGFYPDTTAARWIWEQAIEDIRDLRPGVVARVEVKHDIHAPYGDRNRMGTLLSVEEPS